MDRLQNQITEVLIELKIASVVEKLNDTFQIT